jgi:hypothetical protein
MIVTSFELAPELLALEPPPELQALAARARPARRTSAPTFFRTVTHFLPREQ